MVEVSWRGEVIGLNICRDEAAAAELRARWGDGPVIIERIFEMPSGSSQRARCELANRVLGMMGESLVLDAERPNEELTAALHALSPNAAPLPEPAAPPPPRVPEHDPFASHRVELSAEAIEAESVLDSLGKRDPRTLTGKEKKLLAEAKAFLAPPVAEAEGGALPFATLDPDELAERDPRTLTGREKAALSGGSRYGKPRPRNAVTPDGRDPRTLTGPEKLALGAQHKQRARVAPPPVVTATGLTDAETHELSMLRAHQPSFTGGPRLDGLDGDALIAGQRFELALRRRWTDKPLVRRA